MLRETAEAAALNEAGDADGGASAALHVAAVPGGDGGVGLHPDGAGAAGNSTQRVRFIASLGNEFFMHGDVVHVARPGEQGIRGVRRSQIAVAAALDHKAQIVLAREIYGGGKMLSILGGYGVSA